MQWNIRFERVLVLAPDGEYDDLLFDKRFFGFWAVLFFNCFFLSRLQGLLLLCYYLIWHRDVLPLRKVWRPYGNYEYEFLFDLFFQDYFCWSKRGTYIWINIISGHQNLWLCWIKVRIAFFKVSNDSTQAIFKPSLLRPFPVSGVIGVQVHTADKLM